MIPPVLTLPTYGFHYHAAPSFFENPNTYIGPNHLVSIFYFHLISLMAIYVRIQATRYKEPGSENLEDLCSDILCILKGKAHFSCHKVFATHQYQQQPVWSNWYDARLLSGAHTKMVWVQEFLVQIQALAFFFFFSCWIWRHANRHIVRKERRQLVIDPCDS